MHHVYIIGSKGVPAAYGGFETFVDNLVSHKHSQDIQYHVACAVNGKPEEIDFEYQGAHCHRIPWREIGAARAVTYDLEAFLWVLRHIEENHIVSPTVYVLACRIGPFIGPFARRLHAFGGQLFVNPDGHEWMRSKWSAPVRRYWKISERGMVHHADLVVCDSRAIEDYVQEYYTNPTPSTIYIAYGADVSRSTLANDDIVWVDWLNAHNVCPGNYYLSVGRFVPENNFFTMLQEYGMSDTQRDFVLITDENEPYKRELEETLDLASDSRVKFVGSVYDRELLKKIRENAFAYLHGHEVGGTNPSLLEGLASSKLSLLLDVAFNREVAIDSALYWTKEKGSLSNLLNVVEQLDEEDLAIFDCASTLEIEARFSWKSIIAAYEKLFTR